MDIFNTPRIVKESSRGYDTFSILDDMLTDRQINCVSEIDEESVNSIILQLLYLEKQDPDAEITIYINSPGGSVQDGLALFDVMKYVWAWRPAWPLSFLPLAIHERCSRTRR